MPPTSFYDGFPQLDNGIGLTRNFINDWEKESAAHGETAPYEEPVYLDVVTGTAVAPVMQELAEKAEAEQPNLHVRIVPVENKHFGTTVNVSGLLTAHDIIEQLKALSGPRSGILIPEPALRSGEDIFLDDVSLTAMREEFPASRIEPVQTGGDYYCALLDWPHYAKRRAGETSYMWQSNAGYTKNIQY